MAVPQDRILSESYRRDPRELSAGDLAIASKIWRRMPVQCWCCDRWIHRRYGWTIGAAYLRVVCAVCYRLAVES